MGSINLVEWEDDKVIVYYGHSFDELVFYSEDKDKLRDLFEMIDRQVQLIKQKSNGNVIQKSFIPLSVYPFSMINECLN